MNEMPFSTWLDAIRDLLSHIPGFTSRIPGGRAGFSPTASSFFHRLAE